MSLKKHFEFDGRANRKTYWATIGIAGFIALVTIGIGAVTEVFAEYIAHQNALVDYVRGTLIALVELLVIVFFAWVWAAVSVKRCQDLDKPGWYAFIPGWNILVLPFKKGVPDAHRADLPTASTG
ncbi:MAG: DUF805 domain-containing protein [Candidatus Poribacteria bacterium]|nr:DUF805 domain-containing protein [Candidatus Poribacteria bacterium]MDE0506765.1 DUF805 domain-containing protein [Candidatus Poribacteria bacterium]